MKTSTNSQTKCIIVKLNDYHLTVVVFFSSSSSGGWGVGGCHDVSLKAINTSGGFKVKPLCVSHFIKGVSLFFFFFKQASKIHPMWVTGDLHPTPPPFTHVFLSPSDLSPAGNNEQR